MLDPLTAIGLASNIVQFVNFGSKVISTSLELYYFDDGILDLHSSNPESTTKDLRRYVA